MLKKTILITDVIIGTLLIIALLLQYITGVYNDKLEDINLQISDINSQTVINANKFLFGGVLKQFNESYVKDLVNQTFYKESSKQEYTYDEAIKEFLRLDLHYSEIKDNLIQIYVFDDQKAKLLEKRRTYSSLGFLVLTLALLLSILRGLVILFYKDEKSSAINTTQLINSPNTDRMEGVLEIMTYIYEKGEIQECKEKNLVSKFGEKFSYFSRFALGGSKPYAEILSSQKDKEGLVRLTQDGVRMYYELRANAIKEKRAQNQGRINNSILLATIVMALGAIANVLLGILNTEWKIVYLGTAVVLLIILGIMLTIAFNLFKKH